jgi:hypothetical protein
MNLWNSECKRNFAVAEILRFSRSMPWMSQKWLSREERPAVARRREASAHLRHTKVTERRCLFCVSPLTNGSAVSSDECDDGWGRIVPTIDGELVQPTQMIRAGPSRHRP